MAAFPLPSTISWNDCQVSRKKSDNLYLVEPAVGAVAVEEVAIDVMSIVGRCVLVHEEA